MTPTPKAQRTPDEMAREIVSEHFVCDCKITKPEMCGYCELSNNLAQAIREAVEAERSECAKVAVFPPTLGGNYEKGCCRYTADLIATAISHRSERQVKDG